MKIDSNTKIYGLIGHPVGHSLSPIIHNLAFEHLSFNCIYEIFDVSPECLGDAVKGLRALNVKGFNVTVPYKESIMQYLDVISEEAMKIGAVNTVINENGILRGYNTDGYGFIEAIKDEGEEIAGRDIVLIGAGGAAKAVSVSLAMNGINSITIINRNLDKALTLSNYIKNEYHIDCTYCTIDELNELKNIDILINATSVGMSPHIDESPVKEQVVIKSRFVYDLIYNPQKTLFLRYAFKNGIKCANGLGMLVNQANHAFKLWTGVNFNKELIYKHIQVEGIMKTM